MNFSLERVQAIAAKETRQLRRDRLTFGMIVGLPLLQIVLFGYAINLDVRHLRAAVADAAGTHLSRTFVADLAATQIIDIVQHAAAPAELEELLRQGRIAVGVVIPRDFETRVARGDHAAAQLLVDGSDPTIESVARQLATVPLATRRASTLARAPRFEVRTYYNPERRSPVNIVPALIGVILTLTMVLFTAMAIVRERERGNLEMLIATPVSRVELMAGKILPYIAIGLIQVTIILLLGRWLFAVPMRGSLLDLYLAALLFITANLAIGLLISTLVQTQFQAMQLTVFLFLPSILLSGFMFPFDGMPRAAQLIAEFLPLTHFVRMVRGIALRGADLGDLGSEAAALAATFAVMMTLALLRFRKRLD
ncbi:MAG TPA: ABC transporter permease [Gammaproteobacteria bacterium]|nr:ABC transporter permease [Gammaproteobacteria bacterium]